MKYWIRTSLFVILITFAVSSLVQSIPVMIMTALGASHMLGIIIGIFRLPVGLFVAYHLVLRKKPTNENDLIAYHSIRQFMIIIGIASIVAEIWFMGSNFWVSFLPASSVQIVTFGIVSVPSFAWLVGLVIARFIATREKLVDPIGTKTHYWVANAYRIALIIAIAWPGLSLLNVMFGILLPYPFGVFGSVIVPIVVIASIVILQVKKWRKRK